MGIYSIFEYLNGTEKIKTEHNKDRSTAMNEPPQCVVAIDIGSSGCGYAFSADYTFCNNPCDVSTYRWFAEVGKFTSLKTPAAILFDSKQEFVSFGYNAQETYITILESNDKNNWYYIEGFKMALYSAVESGEVNVIEM